MKMQRSFSIVDDDDEENDSSDEKPHQTTQSRHKTSSNYEMEMIHGTFAPEKSSNSAPAEPQGDERRLPARIPSAGPSGRQTVLKSRPSIKLGHPIVSSESDDDSDLENDKNKAPVSGEYDPKLYEDLDVNDEVKEIFQYITKYIPQPMTLDNKFKPFVPEFLPAVGDIDAFLKVISPAVSVSGEPFSGHQQLGLTVLDEPAANQSDPALLHLQLRAKSVSAPHRDDVVVKKIDNVEKSVKVIDKWIKDISDLHKSKSSPMVRYNEPMPDLDELMQEWPEDVENRLKEDGFPGPQDYSSLGEYVDVVCSMFGIPTKNKLHALHLLFSLYAAIKESQLFKESNLLGKTGDEVGTTTNRDEIPIDQLVLE